MGPSVGRSVVAEMNGKPLGLVQDAILSLRHGLVIDYTRADLLAHLIVFEVLVGDPQADADYQKLRVLAPRSKIVMAVEAQRKQVAQ